jgi:hypothetical protein
LACLAAVEANLAELRDIPDWWQRIGSERRQDWQRVEAQCRADQYELSNLATGSVPTG